MKQPSFAAAVGREEMREGAELPSEVEFGEHVETVIAALAAQSGVLMPQAA